MHFIIERNSVTAPWWNFCLTKPKIIILCLVRDTKQEKLGLGETADQRLISKFAWAALVSWHLRRGLVCWSDCKSECLVYLVTTDPINIPCSQMEQVPLLQPVCAGGALCHWGGNIFFGWIPQCSQNTFQVWRRFLIFKSCNHLEHLFS